MNLAKISTNGQITVPAEIRRVLHVGTGDKIMFVRLKNGEVVVRKLDITHYAANESDERMADIH